MVSTICKFLVALTIMLDGKLAGIDRFKIIA